MLTRIMLFPKKLTFFHRDAQGGDYFGGFFAPILFVFAVLSITLNAMQVELAVSALGQGEAYGAWDAFISASKGFSVFALFVVSLVVAILVFLLAFFCAHDVWFARRVWRKERLKSEGGTGWKKEMTSGVI
jgi:hypothetical protein